MMRVIVQDENGEPLSEGFDFPTPSRLAGGQDSTCDLVSSIDPYGDTVFNRLQIPLLLKDLRMLATQGDPQIVAILPNIERLAGQALQEPHSYIKFIGD